MRPNYNIQSFSIAGAVEDNQWACCTEVLIVVTDIPVGQGSFQKLTRVVDVPVQQTNARR